MAMRWSYDLYGRVQIERDPHEEADPLSAMNSAERALYLERYIAAARRARREQAARARANDSKPAPAAPSLPTSIGAKSVRVLSATNGDDLSSLEESVSLGRGSVGPIAAHS